MKKSLIFIAILMLALLAACGGGNDGNIVVDPTEPPTSEPVVVVTEEPAPVEDTGETVTESDSSDAGTSATSDGVVPSDTGELVSDPIDGTPTVVDITGAPAATLDNTNVYYRLQTMFLEAENKCLESSNASTDPSENRGAFMDDCQNVTGQFWKFVPNGDGYYRLQTMFLEAENKCLEGNRLAPESVLNGAAFMNDCQNVTGQSWKLVESEVPGYYRLQTAFLEGENKCLEGNRNAPESVLGGPSFMDTCQNVTGQLWKLVPTDAAVSSGGTGGQASCYWLSNVTNEWVPTTEIGLVDTTIEQCYALDSCNGGLGQSGGGCYKWTNDPNGEPLPWPNEDVLSGTGSVQIISGSGNQAAGGTTIQLLDDTSVLFLFDASGSMGREKVGGTPRIDIAKQTLTNLVNNVLPDGVSVAFRAFGLQGQAGVCDTELVMPLAPLDRNALTNTINSIQPINGETAIAASLAEARNDLASATGPRQIILLTDGEETCGGDPLKEIEALQQEGFDVQVNIVGFAIDDPALKQQFETWAEAGRGRYFDATNADELEQAIAEALSVWYLILDENGQGVDGGMVDGSIIDLPAGNYTIELYPGFQEMPIAVVNGQTTVLTIQR